MTALRFSRQAPYVPWLVSQYFIRPGDIPFSCHHQPTRFHGSSTWQRSLRLASLVVRPGLHHVQEGCQTGNGAARYDPMSGTESAEAEPAANSVWTLLPSFDPSTGTSRSMSIKDAFSMPAVRRWTTVYGSLFGDAVTGHSLVQVHQSGSALFTNLAKRVRTVLGPYGRAQDV